MQETTSTNEQNTEISKTKEQVLGVNLNEQTKVIFNFSFRFLVHLMHFLFRISISLFAFYFVGNYYSFLDTNQLLCLKVLQSTSAISTIVSFFVFVWQMIFLKNAKKKLPLSAPIRSIVFFLVSAVLVIFSSIIIVISKM